MTRFRFYFKIFTGKILLNVVVIEPGYDNVEARNMTIQPIMIKLKK